MVYTYDKMPTRHAVHEIYMTCKNANLQSKNSVWIFLTLEGIRGGQSGPPPPSDFFFGLTFLFLDRLPKALAQLIFIC